MTPTLFGRWQQRLLLLPTVGFFLSLPLAISQASWYYLLVLIYIGILGCLWDVLYQQLQRMRWDNDWPGLWQLVGGVVEGLFLLLLLKVNLLPALNLSKLAASWIFIHYLVVSVAMFLAAQAVVPILFPHARYRGRQWL
jgi:hypothetical protein